jgi:hypothetical protein
LLLFENTFLGVIYSILTPRGLCNFLFGSAFRRFYVAVATIVSGGLTKDNTLALSGTVSECDSAFQIILGG